MMLESSTGVLTYVRLDGGRRPILAGLRILAVVLIWGLSGCGAEPTAPGETLPPVNIVEVSPGLVLVSPGDTVRLGATPRAADGSLLAGRAIQWSSGNTQVATVASTGLVTGLTFGDAKIRATVEGKFGEATVRVLEPEGQVPQPSVQHLTPSSVPAGTPVVTIIITGTNFAAGAVALWDGVERPGDRVSAAEFRLTIGPSDLLTPRTVAIAVRNPGSSSADSESLPFTIGPVAVAYVTVAPVQAQLAVGQQTQLTVTAYAADGSTLEDRAFTWSASSGSASVDGTGRVTGLHVGVVSITAQSEGRFASAIINVVQPVAFVVVSPNEPGVLVNSSVQLGVATYAPNGLILAGRPVVWSTEDTTIATVNEQGLVAGLRKGTVRILAESEGKVGWATVEVRQFTAGPVQGYNLRGVAGSIIMPAVGTTTWTDAGGVAHTATLFLSGGEFERHSLTSQWVQRLHLAVAVTGIGTVSDTTWVDQGTYQANAFDGTIEFTSSISNGVFTGVPMPAGELSLVQAIGTASVLTYRWVIN